MIIRPFPSFIQSDSNNCGPSCLYMIALYYKKKSSMELIRSQIKMQKDGISFLSLKKAAESIGFKTLAVKTNIYSLDQLPLPFISHWDGYHYVVVYKVNKRKIYVSDPAIGRISYTKQEFLEKWNKGNLKDKNSNIVLLLQPKADDEYIEIRQNVNTLGFRFLIPYILDYKKYLFRLFITLFISSLIGFTFPFLTQSIIDTGISGKNINFIFLILIAQFLLFAGQISIDYLRSWLLLRIGIGINIKVVTDFLNKLLGLPISFFDSKMVGDIVQRISDHQKIQIFLTSSSLSLLFSFISFVVFVLVLLYYNFLIFFIFALSILLILIWILLFFEKRKVLDIQKFRYTSESQNRLFEIFSGIEDIKVNGVGNFKKDTWEVLQKNLYEVEIKRLKISQYQQSGVQLINQAKNLFITFFIARAVISGSLTMGVMLAVSYIVGILNSPIDQLINFVQTGQDARISLDRISEIHNLENEVTLNSSTDNVKNMIKGDFSFDKVSFSYSNDEKDTVLNDISFSIPYGFITAIVGASGSGKTTLLKLLLRYYKPTKGEITLNDNNINNFILNDYRSQIGIVLQNGYIFNDSILNNITLSDHAFDEIKLKKSIYVSQLDSVIGNSHSRLNLRVGTNGAGLSQGQKQRILLARAIYKNPNYFFLDEATSSLDSVNENIIVNNLKEVFRNKTVIIVAHRLSTVKNADQIIVLDGGRIKEIGKHQDLVLKQGYYYNLIKNQLELGT